MKMTHLPKILSVSALFAAGALFANVARAQTNETLVLNIDLSAVSQGTMTNTNGTVSTNLEHVKITSRGIIEGLAAALGLTNVSERAKLVVTTPSNALDNWSAVQIMDGSNVVDVTGFFDHAQGSLVVQGTRTLGWEGLTTTTSYSVDSFSLMNASGATALTEHFNVSGFTAIASSARTNSTGTNSSESVSVSAVVSGTGDNNGSPAVITGSISAESQRAFTGFPEAGQADGGQGQNENSQR